MTVFIFSKVSHCTSPRSLTPSPGLSSSSISFHLFSLTNALAQIVVLLSVISSETR